MQRDTKEWAEDVFDLAYHDAKVEIAALRGQFVNTGPDRGSRSVFPMSNVYLRHMRTALNRCLDGVSNRHLKRDRRWRASLMAIQTVLDAYLERGPRTVTGYLSADLKSAKTLAENHFQKERGKWELELAELRDGWTGASGKSWHERHPILYAFLLMFAGAVVGTSVEIAASSLSMQEVQDPRAQLAPQ